MNPQCNEETTDANVQLLTAVLGATVRDQVIMIQYIEWLMISAKRYPQTDGHQSLKSGFRSRDGLGDSCTQSRNREICPANAISVSTISDEHTQYLIILCSALNARRLGQPLMVRVAGHRGRAFFFENTKLRALHFCVEFCFCLAMRLCLNRLEQMFHLFPASAWCCREGGVSLRPLTYPKHKPQPGRLYTFSGKQPVIGKSLIN